MEKKKPVNPWKLRLKMDQSKNPGLDIDHIGPEKKL
jgi:hypothetical protein